MGKELLVTNMDELFFKLQRVSFKINNDPEWNFTTCIPFGTPYSAIDGVMPLYDYTALQTTRMVIIFHSFLFSYKFFIAFIFLSSFFLLLSWSFRLWLELETLCNNFHTSPRG